MEEATSPVLRRIANKVGTNNADHRKNERNRMILELLDRIEYETSDIAVSTRHRKHQCAIIFLRPTSHTSNLSVTIIDGHANWKNESRSLTAVLSVENGVCSMEMECTCWASSVNNQCLMKKEIAFGYRDLLQVWEYYISALCTIKARSCK